jgi:ABC-type dipeptide/oligopeptide/nickel transport system permease subunit
MGAATVTTHAPSVWVSRWRRTTSSLRQFLSNPLAAAGSILIGAQILIALLGPSLLTYGPNTMDYAAVLDGPSWPHWLGTDELGRDIFSRLVAGSQLSLSIGVASVLLAALVGIPLGLIAGYAEGIIDEIFMRVLDSVIALPPLVLALTIAAVLGTGLVNTTIAIAIVSVPAFARLIRGQVLSLKNSDYIQAAESLGAPVWLIMIRHILPNSLNPVVVQASLAIGFSVITESGLSFIGLGAQPPQSTWGSMVQVGFQYLELQPAYALAPAVAILLAVLGFNMLGEGLRQIFDPSMRSKA